MTRPDEREIGIALRHAMHELVPADLAVPLETIHRRTTRLERHAHVRIGAVVVGVIALATGAAYALPSASRTGSVKVQSDVTAPPRHHEHKVAPSVAKPTITSTTTTARPRVVVPLTPQTSPVPSTPNTAAPAQTPPATQPTTATTRPVPTTTVPSVPSVPIYPGATALFVVLDDTGMHAPASVTVTGTAVELVFFDLRTNRATNGSWIHTEDFSLMQNRYEGQTRADALCCTNDLPAGLVTFIAGDTDHAYGDIPGASLTVNIIYR